MATSHSIPGLSRAIGIRAVHLRLVPRPEGMAESRTILQMLQSYGAVEMFKNLKYDALPAPNTMLAIFQSEHAARELLRASPLRFKMSSDSVEDSPEGSRKDSHEANQNLAGDMSSDRMALAASAARQTSAPSAPAFRQTASPTREYQLQINVATMHHRDNINVNPYNGPFAVDKKSAIQEDLAKRVPLLGLSDTNLKKLEKPWRVLLWEREREKKNYKTLRQMMNEGMGKGRSNSPIS